jgi:hypothetical protein
MLRKRFMTALLFNLKGHIPKKLIDYFYKKYADGFYVHAEDKKTDLEEAVNYILRYISRPVIAKSRILKLENDKVTFCYTDHETEEYAEETICVFEFIKKVIIHIPEKHFNMVRYYGLYAKANRLRKYKKKPHPKLQRQLNLWQVRIILSFSYDPLKCVCGNIMELGFVYNPRAPDKEKIWTPDNYEKSILRNRLPA